MVLRNALSGTGGLGAAVDGLVIEILGGIRHFTGLFLGIPNSTRSDKSCSGSQTSTEGGERKTMIGKLP
jgi:hypothetical protein